MKRLFPFNERTRIRLDEVLRLSPYDSVEHMLRDLYEVQRWSIPKLMQHLGLAEVTVKSLLRHFGIKTRTRGGANNVKVVLTEELIAEISRDGVTAVALRLGVDYTTLQTKLKKLRRP